MYHVTSRTKRHTKCRIIFGIKCDGGWGKEDIRKGMRISSCSANTFANASASFKVQNLSRIFVTERGVQDHLCMVTKADRSDEDWQQGQLAPPPGPVF